MVGGFFRGRKQSVVHAHTVKAGAGDCDIKMVAERFKRFYRDRRALRADGVGECALGGIDVDFKICCRPADKFRILYKMTPTCEKRESAKSRGWLVAEINAAHRDDISVDGCGGGVYIGNNIKVSRPAQNRVFESCRERGNAVGAYRGFNFPEVSADRESACNSGFCRAGNEFVQAISFGVANAAAKVPLAIPHGDKAIGDIRILPDESDFFSDDLHMNASFVHDGFTEGGSRGGSLPLIPQSCVTTLSLGGTNDRSLCYRRNHTRFAVAAAKKKGECNNGTGRRFAQLLRNGQNHGRITGRFRRHIHRVIGYGVGRFVDSLPRHRDGVGTFGVGEVRAAHNNLGSCQDFLVVRTAKSLKVLDCGANARFFNAGPVEFLSLATKIGLRLYADMNFVVGTKKAGFRIDGAAKFRVNAKPSVQMDVASIFAETLNRFKKTVHDAEVREELSGGDILVFHREAQSSRRIVGLLVDDQRAKNGLRAILWIDPRHHAVAQGWLFSRCNRSHILVSINILGSRCTACQHSPEHRGTFDYHPVRTPDIVAFLA